MFAEYGFFIRGAIVYGEVYSDDNISYGRGIVEAVEGEKKAIFPRIIISEELKQIIDENRKSYGGKEYWGDKTLIKLDNYSEYFLNYLDDMDYHCLENVLEIHKKLVEESLKKYSLLLTNYKNDKDSYEKIQKVLEKYEWVKNYHSLYINKYGVPYKYPDIDYDYRIYDRNDLLIK